MKAWIKAKLKDFFLQFLLDAKALQVYNKSLIDIVLKLRKLKVTLFPENFARVYSPRDIKFVMTLSDLILKKEERKY